MYKRYQAYSGDYGNFTRTFLTRKSFFLFDFFARKKNMEGSVRHKWINHERQLNSLAWILTDRFRNSILDSYS